MGYQTQKRIIPCILKEVSLELRKGHSTEIRKRFDMRKVNDLVVAFLRMGHLTYTARPLADAGLYLIVARNSRQIPLKDSKARPQSYQRECQGNSFDWDRCEIFMKDNPVSVLVLKPHHINNLLDDRVPIWVMRSPANVGILYADED